MTSRPQASVNSTSDSNQYIQMTGKQILADPAKGIVRRTRTALGDIGNRLTQKVGASGMEKRVVGKSTTASGLGTKATGQYVLSGQAQNIAYNRSIKLSRTNSLQITSTNNTNPPRGLEKDKMIARTRTVIVRANQSTAPAPVTLVKIEEAYINSKLETAYPRNTAVSTLVGDAESENRPLTINEICKARPKTKINELQFWDIDTLSNAFSLQRFGEVRIEDIDAADSGEFMLKEYVKDIDQYMHSLEKAYPIREDFLKNRSVNSRMRAVLLDWIVDVHNQFGLCQETLYLAGKTLDRYLQLDTTISRNQLQLAGVTALFIAVKFEEVCVPTIVDFSSVSDNAFKPEDVRKMEEKMLTALKFDLASPLPIVFLRRCSKALQINVDSYTLSKLIAELSLLDYNLCHIYPSMMAAASIALAIMVMNKTPIQSAWTESVVHYTRYTLAQLKPVIRSLVSTLSRPYEEKDNSRYNASLNKFARSKLMRISKLPELKALSWKDRVLAEVAKIQ